MTNQGKLYRAARRAVELSGASQVVDDCLTRISNGVEQECRHNELIYQGICNQLATFHELPFVIYPSKGGANYSLLYLVARIVADLPISNVLELGVGATTKIIHHFSTARNFRHVAVDDSPDWANRMSQMLEMPVTLLPRMECEFRGVTCQKYDISSLHPNDRFDFIVVDGPAGSKRYSRMAAIELVRDRLMDDFILLFDDSNRPGETETISECRSILAERKIETFEHHVSAISTQTLIVTNKFKDARYF